MRNVEIKTPLKDRESVERRLEALGARRMWCRRQRDTFYDVPTGWLKLREADGCPAELISYRRSKEHSGPRLSEFDVVPVRDSAVWLRLLGRVLPVLRVVEKERTLWLYEHTRIHLDRVAGLGDFLELETLVVEIGPNEAHAETDRVIYALCLDPDDFVSSPYCELVPAE